MEEELMPEIERARCLIDGREFTACEAMLSCMMFDHPHAAVPHNLMGLLLEKEGRHADAMRHFRAAYALEPDYMPAAWNIECYSGFTAPHGCAYVISDCTAKTTNGKAGFFKCT